ncbi:MAG: MaoC family dehydratase [Chloroflexota bacterium]|nr:MaoC family dehydratase [Chloroflexota bacterium]
MKGFQIGQSATAKRRFTEADVAEFHGLAGGVRPQGYEATIPGPLIGAIFSYLLGTELPGYGTNYLKQSLTFLAPAYPDEELTATVEVTRLRPEKELVNLRTVCINSRGEVICAGEALVLVRDV